MPLVVHHYHPDTYLQKDIHKKSHELFIFYDLLLPLPPSGTVAQPPDNIDMVAVGWGTTSSGSNTVSQDLLQVTLQSIP
ncbi:unnamed protein product, partial [Rotaria socialis]